LLLRRPDLTEEKKERYLRAIAETADRATKLTSQLLAFGRRQPLKPEVLDLNLRLDALAEMLQRTIGSRYELRLNLAPSLCRVEADPTGLETAVLNAVLNARDAMPQGGRLTLSTENRSEPDGDMVCLSIADEGQGIPAAQLERVFEPFFTTKPVGKGTGLGLSQIHGFAAQSGGRAEIESTEGKGTIVRILLPHTDKKLSAPVDEVTEAQIPHGLEILLVEDSVQVRDFARHLLEDLHCRVVEAANGDEALAILRERKVDLVFSDVVMPGMTGVELARRIRAEIGDVPLLLATGYSDQLAKEDRQAFHVLSKPYKPDTLAAAVAQAVQGSG
jgi:CheY-like chemotaxis protein